jgi:hypothetical protein
MTKILDELPYLDCPETIVVQGESIRLKPFQIIVWISVHIEGVEALEPNAPRFPAILDTGNNHTFTITERQLRKWAGIRAELLPLRGSTAGRVVVIATLGCLNSKTCCR